ncbi:MAG: (2Fe-2S)-binding protein [Candidatus Omnitrophica bacterium]|nr:(2Fe-2S)-binding protein [Candidatus Omnitrophota bacterium]
MPKINIDGKEIEVPQGSTVMEAAERAGVSIPYYCWHPGLSVAGNCRMCLVEMQRSPKPVIACNTQCADGMVIKTQSEMAKKARAGTLEFLLANHPLDCPVCDQAGECELQNFYMNYGLYDARFDEEKIKKHKAVPIGPTIMLDSERCILCSRCVRFCDEITHTGELGIVGRGDQEEITVYPGKELNNNYSGNVADICPVGALTDRDFRFKCRVWYLTPADSICPGCSRGCNIRIDSNHARPHHAKGERLMRLKPRENQAVNQWWMCDEGRYGYKFVDQNRILEARGGGIKALAEKISQAPKAKLAVLVSPQLSNEDLYALRTLFKEQLGVAIDCRWFTKQGRGDDFLLQADKSPNTRGAQALGLVSRFASAEEMLSSAEALISFGVHVPRHFLADHLKFSAYIGSNINEMSGNASIVIPSSVYAEKDGTFTNFDGRVQRFWQAFPPLGEAKAEWEIVNELAILLGLNIKFESAEAIFTAIAATVPQCNGMSYEKLGKQGMQIKSSVVSRES